MLRLTSSISIVRPIFALLFLLGLFSQTAFSQSVTVNTTDPRHEGQDQASIAVLFSGNVSGTSATTQWTVQVNGVTVTTTSVALGIPSSTYATVSFDATGVNGVPYVLPGQALTIRFINTGNTLLVGGVASAGTAGFVASKNNWAGDCTDVTFFQLGLITGKTADQCVPVVEDFTQFQYYLGLRVRNSALYAGGSLIHSIQWGDGNTTGETSYQSDATGAASTTFVTTNGGFPVVIQTSRPTHTYPNSTTPPGGTSSCGWTATITPVLNYAAVTACNGQARTTIFANYDTDNKNTGTLNMPPYPNANSNLVCRGTNVGMQFQDNTLLNCRAAVESRVTNDQKRNIRITYGWRDNGGVGNIPDVFVQLPAVLGGATVRVTNNDATGTRVSGTGFFPTTGAADGNGVITVAAPVTAATARNFMGTIITTDPTKQVVAQRLWVRMEYWDVCNAYNPLNAAGTLPLAESIENFVEIVTTPPSPTFSPDPPTFCESVGGAAMTISSAGTAGSTYKWYRATGPLGNLQKTGTTFNPTSEATPTVSASTIATTNFYLTETLTNGCESLPTTVPFTVNKVTVPGVIAHPGPLTLCATAPGEDPPAFTSTTAASGGDGTTYNYQWQRKNDLAAFADIAGATLATYDPPALVGFTSIQFRRSVKSGACATVFSNTITFTLQQPVTAGAIGGTQTVCSGGDPTVLTNTTTPTQGGGGYVYLWESSTTAAAGPYTTISGATAITYDPPAGITQTTFFRRRVTAGVATGACPGFATTTPITVTVDQAVVAGVVGNSQVVCASDDPAAFTDVTPASGGNGSPPTYQWQSSTTLAGVYTNIAGATGATYDPPVLASTLFYKRVASSGACPSASTAAVSITVNPLPSVSAASGGGAVCSGNPAPNISFTLVGTPPFTLSYSITAPGPGGATGVTEPTNTFTIVGPTIFGTYKITSLVDNNGCVAPVGSLTPTATVSSGGTPPTFVSGPTLDITSACFNGTSTTDPQLVFQLDAGSASQSGFVLTYKVDGGSNRTKTFATNAARNASPAISFPNGTDPELDVLGAHTITMVAIRNSSGCQTLDNTVLNFTVNPVPALANPTNPAKTICSHAAVNYEVLLTPANTPAGTKLSWPDPDGAGPASASPVGGVNADPAGTFHITDVLTNITGSPITVTYVVTPTSSLGCPGPSKNFNIRVMPRPTIVAAQTKTICSGDNTNFEVLMAPANLPAGTKFSWAAPTVSAGPAQGAASAVGGVNADPAGTKHISQVLTNTTGAPITVTYNVVATGPAPDNCAAPSVPVVFTVNPAPVIVPGQVKTICSGNAVNLEVLMSPLNTPAGTKFNWADPDGAGPATASPVGGVNADPAGTLHLTNVLTNFTGNNINVTYNIVATSNASPANCSAAAVPVVITVRPEPKLVSPQSKTICSGQNTNYEIKLSPLNLPAGTTFTWPDPDGPAGPASAGTAVAMGTAGTIHISDVLTNFTAAPVTTTYVITPTSGAGCPGAASNVDIIVNPLPTANPITGPGTVCTNPTTTLLYQVTPNAGSTYAWTVPAPFVKFAGGNPGDFFVLVRFPTVGTGTISVIETNSFGCAGTANTLFVTSAGAPGALSINGPDPVCKNQTGVVYSIPAGVFTPASTYTWTASGATITSAASGPGLQQVTVDFGLSSSAQITVAETSSSGCSGTPFTKTIAVADRPTMTSGTSSTTCSGVAPGLVFTSTLAATYDWVVTGITGSIDNVSMGQTGTGNLSATFTGAAALKNTSGVVGSVSFEVTPSGSAAPNCQGPVQTVTVLVNPEPVILTGQTKTICSGQSVNYEILLDPANLPAGTTFSWAAPVMSDASVQGSSGTNVPMGSAGTKHILDVLTNTTGAAITATYTISATSGALCTSTQTALQRRIVITVNPQPVLAAVTNVTVCPGQTVGPINFSANTLGGETFSWTNDNALVGVGTSGLGNILAYSAPANNTGADIVGNFSVTATKNGCVSSAVTFKITIKPQPVVSPISDITVCPGDNIGPINFVANSGGGETFNWTNTNPAVGVAISGTGNIASYVAPANLTGAAFVGDFSVTATKNGCTSTPVTFKITVKPEPVISPVSSVTVCPGQLIGPITFAANTGGGETFSWTNDNTAVGLASSGTGSIASYAAPVNTTGAPFTANIVVTTSKNGCNSAPVNFQIIVKPQPVMSAVTDVTVCPGQTVSAINFTANTGGGETFNWTNDNPSVGVAASGTGNIASFIAPANATGGNFVGNFSVTATLNGCVSAPVTFKITVKPAPVVNPVTSVSVCPGATVGPFTFSANTGGSETFTWTNDNTLVGLGGSGSGNIGSFTAAANLTGSNIVANISVVATKNGCSSTPLVFTITVKPQPVVTAQVDLDACPGQTVGPINFTANTGGGETFSWTNDNTTIGLAGSGTGNIASFVAPSNLTGSNFLGNVTVTATKNGCVSSVMTFKITIKPQPVVTAIADIAKCPGQSVGPVNFVANTGGSETFNWTNDNPAIGIGASGTGNIASFTAPVNLTGSPITGNISVTAVKNGCTSSAKTFSITINPQPVMNAVTNISVCPGQTVGPVAFSANTGGGETFAWTNSNIAIGLASSGTGNIPSYVAPANISGSSIVGTISVTATLNGCTSLAGTFTITIKPQPVVSAVSNITVCPGQTIGPIAFTANTGGGETFNWTSSNAAIGLASSGTGTIASYTAPANATGTAFVSVISVTAVQNGCSSAPVTFNITVSPQPVVNNISNITVCPGQTIGPINFGANTGGGETFIWTNSNTAVGLAASGSGNIASYTAPANVTGAAFVATVSVTATLNSCASSPPKTFTITVNPQPVVTTISNVSVCPTATVGPFNFAANTGGGETFNWTNTNPAIGLGASGTGNIASWAAPTNTTGSAFVGTISVIATKNGCSSVAMTYTVTIKPTPVVTAQTNITVCPGEPIGPINFAANTGGGEVFNWTNSNTAIGQPASGTGDIASYLAPANLTGVPIVANFSVIATKTSCASAPMAFTITIKPQPVVTTVASISVCPGATIGPINFSANTAGGETFTWTNTSTAIGLAASGTGNIAAFAAPANLTGSAFVGNISVTATKNGCVSSAMLFSITVKPEPVVNPISDISVCPGATVGPVSFTANTGGGETFNWTNNNTAVGLAASGTGNIASYTAPVNNTGSDFVATVSVTATKTSCVSVVKTFQITIKAVPVIAAQSNISVCSGATIGPINFTANTGGGETFSWTNSNTGVGLGGSGTGNIPAYTSPTNVTASDIVGTITVTASKGACVSTSMVFTITVKPKPVVSPSLDITRCSNAPYGLNLATDGVSIGAASYDISAVVAGGLVGTATTGLARPANAIFNDVFQNTTASPLTVTYTVTPNGTNLCIGDPKVITFTINPEPVLFNPGITTICSRDITSIILATNGTSVGASTYRITSKTYSTDNGVTFPGPIPANFTDTGNAPVNVSLPSDIIKLDKFTNTRNGAVIVRYVIVPRGPAVSGSCDGTPVNIDVRVNPQPTLDPALNPSPVCSGVNSAVTLGVAPGSVGAATYNIKQIQIDAGLVALVSAPIANGQLANAIFNDTYQNTTGSPLQVRYTISPVSAGPASCEGPDALVTLTINPAPQMAANLDKTVCTGVAGGITLSIQGTPPAINYNIVSITMQPGLVAAGGNATVPANAVSGTYLAADVFNNPTDNPLTVTYRVEPRSAANCIGPQKDIVLTIEPTIKATPVSLKASVCSTSGNGADPIDIEFVSPTTPTAGVITFNYTAVSSIGGQITGFVPALSSLAEGYHITDNLVNSSNAVGTVTYTITPVANGARGGSGCTGAPAIVVINVEPKPKLIAQSFKTICENSAVGVALSSNTAPSAGVVEYLLANVVATGGVTGMSAIGTVFPKTSILNDILSSPSSVSETVTYTLRPRINGGPGCIGDDVDITITVNPVPNISATDPAPVCNGTEVTVPIISDVANTVSTWTFSVSPGGPPTPAVSGASNGLGTDIFAVLFNNTDVPQTVTYHVTPKANGCTPPASTLDIHVVVDPTPKVTGVPNTKTVCHGATLNVPLTSNVAGATFDWVVDPNVLGVPLTGSGNTIIQPMTNTTGNQETLTYTITPKGPGGTACVGPSKTLVVTVAPMITAQFLNPNPDYLCKGSTEFLSIQLDGQQTFKLSYTDGTTVTNLTNKPAFTFISVPGLTTNTTFTLLSVTDALGCTITPAANPANFPVPSLTVNVGIVDANFTILNPSPECSPKTAQFQYNQIKDTWYTWTFGDAADSVGQQVTTNDPAKVIKHIYSNDNPGSPRTFKVSLTNYVDTTKWLTPVKGCAKTSVTQNIVVYPQVIVNVLPDRTTICSGEAINVTNSSQVTTAQTWSYRVQGQPATELPISSTRNLNNFTLVNNSASNPIIYEIIYRGTNGHCPTADVLIPITVYRSVTANFDDGATPHLYVNGESNVTFTNTSTPVDGTIYNYVWEFGSDAVPATFTGPNPPVVKYIKPGPKTVKLTASNATFATCTSTFSKVINIDLPPLVATFLASPSESCFPSNVEVIQSNITGDIIQWKVIDQNGRVVANSSAAKPLFEIPASGKFTITLQTSNSQTGQVAVATPQTVTIYPKPRASFLARPETVFVPDTELTTQNLSTGANQYYWDFDFNGDHSTEEEPKYVYKIEGVYNLALYAQFDHGNNIVCADTLIQKITAKQGGVTKVPNAFTPNLNGPGAQNGPGDNANDVFLPIVRGAEEYNLQIYDRWGNLIFESNSTQIGWDGYNNDGKLLPAGVYVYKLTIRLSDGQRTTQIGDVTMIR